MHTLYVLLKQPMVVTPNFTSPGSTLILARPDAPSTLGAQVVVGGVPEVTPLGSTMSFCRMSSWTFRLSSPRSWFSRLKIGADAGGLYVMVIVVVDPGASPFWVNGGTSFRSKILDLVPMRGPLQVAPPMMLVGQSVIIAWRNEQNPVPMLTMFTGIVLGQPSAMVPKFTFTGTIATLQTGAPDRQALIGTSVVSWPA